MNKEIIIQITSGRGPEECCWVVSQVLKVMLHDASCKQVDSMIIQSYAGNKTETLDSALIKFTGLSAESFVNSWLGTILWVGESPYRKYHKRKNWYIGIREITSESLFHWKEEDLSFQTMRASGPGGQHVNKTESAVRAIHNPTGTSVTASDNRSQLQNKKLAIERLRIKMEQQQTSEIFKKEYDKWQQHNSLERGNPVRIFKGKEFVAVL